MSTQCRWIKAAFQLSVAKIAIFGEGTTSGVANFHAGPLSKSNQNQSNNEKLT